jgi:hypothetical protein
MMKNCSIFAAFKTKRTKNISVDGIFYARLDACICKDKEAVQIPAVVIGICQFFWSRMGGERPFLYSILNFSLAMTKRNENASKVKYSNHTSTPDCESVRDLSLSQNFIPTVNDQGIGNVEASDVTGCNNSGSDNTAIFGSENSL